jgi:hypothetical protein
MSLSCIYMCTWVYVLHTYVYKTKNSRNKCAVFQEIIPNICAYKHTWIILTESQTTSIITCPNFAFQILLQLLTIFIQENNSVHYEPDVIKDHNIYFHKKQTNFHYVFLHWKIK